MVFAGGSAVLAVCEPRQPLTANFDSVWRGIFWCQDDTRNMFVVLWGKHAGKHAQWWHSGDHHTLRFQWCWCYGSYGFGRVLTFSGLQLRESLDPRPSTASRTGWRSWGRFSTLECTACASHASHATDVGWEHGWYIHTCVHVYDICICVHKCRCVYKCRCMSTSILCVSCMYNYVYIYTWYNIDDMTDDVLIYVRHTAEFRVLSNPKASKLCWLLPLGIADSCGESTRCRIQTMNLRPDRPHLWPGQGPGDAGDAGCFFDLNLAKSKIDNWFSFRYCQLFATRPTMTSFQFRAI